jgi:NTE family protein
MINNFRHFYGYDFLSLAGNSYIKGRVTADWEFYRKNHFNFSANYAIVGNNIYDEGDFFSRPDYSGYAFGYGLETIIGPIEIKHSWSPETKDHLTWISVGFWF